MELSDAIGPLLLAAIVVGARPIVVRMVRVAEADPSRMCARCGAERQYWPLLVRMLMPCCGDSTCATHPRYGRTRP